MVIYMNKMWKQIGIIIGMMACLAGCGKQESFAEAPLKAAEKVNISFKEVSVHDPSIVRDQQTYYIFGSHLAGAKSEDLMNWRMIGNGVKKGNPIIDDPLNEMKEAFNWAKTGTFWAPDVIQLEDGRYHMYYCNCEGSSPLSALGIAVADQIEGPYKDEGIILKSGMTDTVSENGDFYDATVYPNVVDPCVFYDAQGKLWMMYGSYSGGIYILELDTKTGRPLESGYGKRLLGGNHLRIEGAYVLYHAQTQYYYMFLSFGGLDADGGYNIRVCRSKNPDGPYYDSMGNEMIDCAGADGSFFDDRAAEKYGTKLMGNYKWTWKEGEDGERRNGLLSPGHNSVIYEEESGKYYIIFHTRFEGKGDAHQVRVHQMFFNADGWPVLAPYRYTQESIGSYQKSDVAGIYKYINHGHEISEAINESTEITLYSNGKIEGAVSGKWKLIGDHDVELTINKKTYRGVFAEEYDEFGEKYVMTFTALSTETGQSIWGSNIAARN